MTSLLLTAFVFVVLCCLTDSQEPKQSLALAFVPATSDSSYTVHETFDFESWLVEITSEQDLWEQEQEFAAVPTVEAHATVDAIESLPKLQLLLAPAKSDVEIAKVDAEVVTVADTEAQESTVSLSKKELISRIKSKGFYVPNVSKMSKAEVRQRYNEMLSLEARGHRA